MSPPPPGQVPGAPAARTSPKAITALVLGIAAFCLAWVPFLGLLVAIGAIILGVLGMKETDQDPAVTGKGLAIAGLVIGIIAAVSGLFWTIWMVFLGVAIWDEWGNWEDFESVGQMAMVFLRS